MLYTKQQLKKATDLLIELTNYKRKTINKFLKMGFKVSDIIKYDYELRVAYNQEANDHYNDYFNTELPNIIQNIKN